MDLFLGHRDDVFLIFMIAYLTHNMMMVANYKSLLSKYVRYDV